MSVYDYPEKPVIKITLTNTQSECTHCGEWFETDMRHMGVDTGHARNQPQCRRCRGRYRK